MPYREVYVEPEVVLRSPKGKIYRAYKHDNADEPYTYWFANADGDQVDVRTLPNPLEMDPETEGGRLAILRHAINSGHLAGFMVQED